MEYSTSANGPFITCTDVSTSVDPGTYYVRYAKTDVYVESDVVVVVVPEYQG